MQNSSDEAMYTTPSADPSVERLCPQCGKAMEFGHLISSSSIRWMGESQSKARKMLLGGVPISEKTPLLRSKHAAEHCPSCGLYLMQK
ncbi:PF20097 family protein [Persicirhabdus sediminis]|uniref:DUF6487 domain-containing protein n=1 Tax=Persicirhabdus sediminis TaxID=454144 RepID=A0A8J7MAY7_9BACT|nr:PF20097 family protein [Persicirhabdus sediminis]MBK1789651.1 hypothetical protein [Persicirhabdus sediminis]